MRIPLRVLVAAVAACVVFLVAVLVIAHPTSEDLPPTFKDPGSDLSQLAPVPAVEASHESPNCLPYLGNYTALENKQPGAKGWQLGNKKGVYTYLSSSFATCGDTLDVYASGPKKASATISLYRLGYYGGVGARLLMSEPVSLTPGRQARADITGASGEVRPTYSAVFDKVASITVKNNWVPGLYAVKVSTSEGFGQTAYFARTNPGGDEPVVAVVGTNTVAAYNAWGGASAYKRVDQGGKDIHGGSFIVDYNRPLLWGNLMVENREWPIIAQLEANGVPTSVVTDEMFKTQKDVFKGHKSIVFSAHSEYWSQSERDQVYDANASGTSVLNFGANQNYWRVRWLKDGRRFSIYRTTSDDPLGNDPSLSSVRFRDAGEPEYKLFGVMYGCLSATGKPTVPASSWLLTGMPSSLGALSTSQVPLPRSFLGGNVEVNVPSPLRVPPSGTEFLSTTSIVCKGGSGGTSWSMTYRPATTSNGMVFDAATCAWAALNSSRPWPTLDELHLVNLMTRNIFKKALGSDLYRFEKTKRGVVLNMGLPSMAPVED